MKVIFKNSDLKFESFVYHDVDLVSQLDKTRVNSSNPPIADDGTFDYQNGELTGSVEYSQYYYVTRFVEIPDNSTKFHYIGGCSGTAGFAFYNSSKSRIGSVVKARDHVTDPSVPGVMSNYTMDIPEGTKYVRATVGIDLVTNDTFQMLVTCPDV